MGCLTSASFSARPPLTSAVICSTATFRAGSLVWVDKMSKQRKMGMPASIIVANCREKTTSDLGFIFFCPRLTLDFFLTAFISRQCRD